MSHQDQILKRLKEAGPRGVHSFQLLDITPRYAARICELNKLGHDISSEPERSAKAIGVRYTLNVGSSTEGRDQAGTSIPQSVDATLGVASGVADEASSAPSRPPEGSSAPPESLFDIPSAYDPWERAA